MPITVRQAAAYCSKSELELVRASTRGHIESLTPGRLSQKIDRARKLRDKFRSLADRQAREARGKQSPRARSASQSNQNTRLKEQVFAESLERFEAAFAKSSGVDAGTPRRGARAPLPKSPKASSGKAARSSASAADRMTTKKSAKKTSKKAVKKASKKTAKKSVSKQAPDKPVAKKSTVRKTAARTIAMKAGAKAMLAGTAFDGSGSTAPEGATNEPAKAIRRQAKSQDAAPKRKLDAILEGGRRRADAHVSSRGRRNQARRDSKS